jgi:transposase
MLNRRYQTDLTDAAWELVKPLLPAAGHGGRPRTWLDSFVGLFLDVV